MTVNPVNSPKLVLNTKDFWKQSNEDLFSGDSTQIGDKLYSGAMDKVDLSKAVLLNTKFNIYSHEEGLQGEKLLESFREKGLSAEVDWWRNGKDFELASCFSIGDAQASFDKIAEYMASKYVALKQQISRDFSGDAMAKQLEILEQLTTSATENLAKSFSESVGAFYEENGLAGEKEKMYLSVKSVVQNEINRYQQYAETNKDYVDFDDPRDQWLLRCSDYVASELREAVKGDTGAASGTSKDGLYDLEQLQGSYNLAHMANHLSNSYLGGATREEQQMRAGVLLLETEIILQKSGATDDMKDVLNHYMSKYVGSDGSGQNSIVSSMLDTFKATNDIRKAVDVGIKTGLESIAEKGISSDFWKYMQDKPPHGADYSDRLSTQEKIYKSIDSMLGKAGIESGLLDHKVNVMA